MKRDLAFAIGAVIVVLAVCFGLAAVRPNLPPTPSTPFSEDTGQTVVGPNDRVVMRVNGEPVTEREFQAFLEQAPEDARPFYNSPQGRPLLAQQLVKLKALEQEGRRLGVEKDPDAALRLRMARQQVVAAFALQKLVAKPSDTRLRAEYEKEKKNFETTDLSHILIAYQGGAVPPRQGHPPLTVDQAMKKAQAIEAQLRKGVEFAAIARAESDDDGSARAGGILGPVQPGSLPPELQRAVSTLKEGEISNPVKSAYGVHIFKAGSKEGRRYEELKPMFAAKLQRDDAELAIVKLQKSAKVELDPKFFPPAPPKRELPPPRKGS
ncbi:MAG TPA: peptidylprolyl isomerase [Thermoanaerobaculia bacterium]|nr:peptidylprolyl isomerase [Thermoanaerobaculia bacterium]